MTRRTFKLYFNLIFVLVIGFTLSFSWSVDAQDNLSSVSGRVVDAEGKPVTELNLAIKPVKFERGMETIQRIPFESWDGVVTDTEGKFSFKNIDMGPSQFTMFPEHGSDYEIISININDMTFHSTAFRENFPTAYGKLTFTIEEGQHLENVIINVKTPRTRIRGRVLLQDGTPLANQKLWLTVKTFRRTFSGGGGGSSGRNVWTDNQGYFVTYNASAGAENTVIMSFNGISAKSEVIIIKQGERYDDLVFTIKNSKRIKDRDDVWIGNPHNGSAYKIIQCKDWEDANTKAAAENAYIVAINDKAEQEWLDEIFPNKTFYWIGLNVPKEGTSWQWNDGQPVTYTNWVTSMKPEVDSSANGPIPVAMEFYSKRWIPIASDSAFLPAVKQAILEKEGKRVLIPEVGK